MCLFVDFGITPALFFCQCLLCWGTQNGPFKLPQPSKKSNQWFLFVCTVCTKILGLGDISSLSSYYSHGRIYYHCKPISPTLYTFFIPPFIWNGTFRYTQGPDIMRFDALRVGYEIYPVAGVLWSFSNMVLFFLSGMIKGFHLSSSWTTTSSTKIELHLLKLYFILLNCSTFKHHFSIVLHLDVRSIELPHLKVSIQYVK